MSAVVTNINDLDVVNGIYRYADYLLWKFQERVELLKGKIFKMAAPSPTHQEISGLLFVTLFAYFKDKKCKVYHAPFDVRLPRKNEKDEEILTVLQPDLCVICNTEKIDSRGCLGAPDLVVEILSPGNSQKELDNKFRIYEEAGVAEYWIVDPEHEAVWVNVLRDGEYVTQKPVTMGKTVTSVKFADLEINTVDIFTKNN
jgi:hypothetical protein